MKKSSTKHLVKKQREAYFLNRVKSVYNDFPPGEIVSGEEPDFLIKGSCGTIGVEVVDYVRGQGENGSAMRAREIVSDRIIDLAKAEFEQNHNIPVMVHCHWATNRELSARSHNELSRDLAKLVSANVPQEIYDRCTIETDLYDDLTVAEFILTVSIVRLKPHHKCFWANVGVGFSGVNSDEMQNLILNKEPKVDAYLKKCDAVWLLIVADASRISSICDLHKDVYDHKYKSRFERIIFYDASHDRISELKTIQ